MNETTILIISNLLSIGVGIYIGRILRTELKSKQSIIDGQKGYLKTQQEYIDKFDWKAAERHYEQVEIPRLKEKWNEEFYQLIHQWDEETKYSQQKYEMQIYLYALLTNYNRTVPGIAKEIVTKNLPSSEQYFQGIWANDEPQTPALSNSSDKE